MKTNHAKHKAAIVKLAAMALGALGLATTQAAQAAEWSDTEVLYNYGSRFREPFNPFGAVDLSRPAVNYTNIEKQYITLQHASGHKYGRNFFFLDLIDSRKHDPEGGGHGEIYGEWYSSLSLSKVSGTKMEMGFIRDVNITGGINYGAKSNGANPRVLLLGPTVDLNVPGFIFFNVDILAYKDSSHFSGVDTIDKTTWQITPSWLAKFSLGPTKWVFTGHIDWIGKRCQKSGPCSDRGVETLAQPELRMDVGDFFGKAETFYVGMKYNYWKNKFGYSGLNEHNPQFQIDWKF